jgi:ubiquinone/menaquinone biosynthesis C-methylase UbiE
MARAGFNAGCRIVAVDLSQAMLERAIRRVDSEHWGQIKVARMDAAHLALPSGGFDAVYVPYTMSR